MHYALNPAYDHPTANQDPLPPPTVPTSEVDSTPSANTRDPRKRKREVKFDLTPPSADTQGARKRNCEVKIDPNRRLPWRPVGVFDQATNTIQRTRFF